MNSKKLAGKKLSIHREAVRTLNPQEASQVGGGIASIPPDWTLKVSVCRCHGPVQQ